VCSPPYTYINSKYCMLIDIAYAAKDVAEAAVESAPEGVLGSLGLNLKLFIAQLINFGIIFFILWRFAFRPITKVLDDRKKTIDESIENAKKAKTNMEMAEAAYTKKVDEAVARANTMVADGQVKANEIVGLAKQQAHNEVERVIAEARNRIKEEKEKMRKEIKEEMVAVVVATVEKILEEKLDEKKDAALVKKMIEQI